ALSADGKSLWTYGHGGPIHCWDWATGKKTGQRSVPGSAIHASVAADGRFVFADSKDLTFCGANAQKTRPIEAVQLPLTPLVLSPDGKWVATRSGDHSVVRLWDATTGKEWRTLRPARAGAKGSADVVTETTGAETPDLVFSADGRFLAGGGPTQLCLWDVA